MRALEIAARQHGVVTRQQAFKAGMSRRQVDAALDRGLLVTVHRGVYRAAGAKPTFEQSVLAACLAARGVASHSTAATLWQLRGWDTSLVEVTVLGRRGPRLEGVRGHSTDSLDRSDVTRRGQMPLTSPARTLLDLGAVGPLEAVEAAVEDAIHRRLVTPARLEAVLTRLGQPGRPGVATLRAILTERGAGAEATESLLEDAFLRLLRDAGLPSPERQYVIRMGAHLVRLDFAYPRWRIAFELDGLRWHSSRADLDRDRAKANLLAAAGWRLLRFGWADVHENGDEVVAVVDELLRVPTAVPAG